MARPPAIDRSILEMARLGYETQKAKIEAAIADIRAQLDGHDSRDVTSAARQNPEEPVPKKFSAATRRRMAAAQRKRWSAARASGAASENPKRKLSTAGRKAIVDAARRRWAALRNSKTAVG
jgi:hypothetical protein